MFLLQPIVLRINVRGGRPAESEGPPCCSSPSFRLSGGPDAWLPEQLTPTGSLHPKTSGCDSSEPITPHGPVIGEETPCSQVTPSSGMESVLVTSERLSLTSWLYSWSWYLSCRCIWSVKMYSGDQITNFSFLYLFFLRVRHNSSWVTENPEQRTHGFSSVVQKTLAVPQGLSGRFTHIKELESRWWIATDMKIKNKHRDWCVCVCVSVTSGVHLWNFLLLVIRQNYLFRW